jgi:transcription-repair coupling factor (superfamily II helicase)
MRDLEIRGAGNILGTEQSGNIASVGYELYCQLLENAVRAMKNQPVNDRRHVVVDLPVTAYMPSEFIPPGRAKIEIYRRLSDLASIEQLRDFESELQDRFGKIPKNGQRLLSLQEIQILARLWKVNRVYLEDGFIVLSYNEEKYMKLLKQSRLKSRLRIVDKKQAYYLMKDANPSAGRLLGLLKKMLQPFS